jgi:hypothetical protein
MLKTRDNNRERERASEYLKTFVLILTYPAGEAVGSSLSTANLSQSK